MKRSERTTLLMWQTRNWRKTGRVVQLCQNYGLKPLASKFYTGRLNLAERKQVAHTLERMLTKKTDKYYLFPLCKDCFDNSSVDKNTKNGVFRPPFEIV